jgi:hypothetical protein
VKVEVTTTKEVFTVDFIKPGAGTLQTKAALDPANQYFTKIDNVIEDTTIEAIKNALVTVTGALPTAPKGKSTGLMPIGAKAAVTPFDKIIAVGVVSVNDPNAKEKIHDFLCRHLNGCSNPVCPVTIEPKATRTTPSFPSAMPVGTPKVSGASLKLLQAGGYVTGNDAGPKVTPIAPNLLK